MGAAKGISHLLIITPGFPADENDTASIPAVQQFVLCFQRVHPHVKISIISFHYPYKRASYSWHGAEVHTIGNKHAGGIRKAIALSKLMRIGKRIHKDGKIDAILCLWLTDSTLGGKMLSKLLGIPYFIWMHGQDAKPGNKYVRMVNPLMTQLAAISEPQRQLFKASFGDEPAYVIPNGINKEIFPSLNTGTRDIDLVAVGSLIPLKQYHLFIEIVRFLIDQGHKTIKAVLLGNGELEPELRSLIVQYGLEENITCKGRLLHNEVLQQMNNAKILVHPSMYEGHSTVMLEALYSGCNVVSLLPVAAGPVDNFIQCSNVDVMRNACRLVLANKQDCQRVLVNDMEASAQRIKHILDEMHKTSV